MIDQNELYHTSDLYVAAWLLSNGFQIRDIDRLDKRRCDFIFGDRPDRSELVRAFLQGSVTGKPPDNKTDKTNETVAGTWQQVESWLLAQQD